RVLVGSHRDIARRLVAAGEEGVPFAEATNGLDLDAYPVAHATGNAGDVYLCHPFVVHAADEHHGTRPRAIAQPPLESVEGHLDRNGPAPVERAMRSDA